jgi:hypothetical protein
VVVLEASSTLEEAPGEVPEFSAAAVGEGESRYLVDGVLGAVTILRVGWEGADDEAGVGSTPYLEGSNEDVVATTLHRVFTAEVAAEVTELSTRHVHSNPDGHVLEISEEGDSVLASAEGEAGVARGVFREGAGVAVAFEVGLMLVANVSPPGVAAWGVFADLEGELVDRVVPRGTATVGAVEDPVAVVLVLVDVELADTRGEEVEVGEGFVAEDVEAVGGLRGGHDGGARRGAVHVTSEATELAALGDDGLGVDLVEDVASRGAGGEAAVVREDNVEVTGAKDIEGESSNDTAAAHAREGVVAGEEVHGVLP